MKKAKKNSSFFLLKIFMMFEAFDSQNGVKTSKKLFIFAEIFFLMFEAFDSQNGVQNYSIWVKPTLGTITILQTAEIKHK